MPSSRRSRPMRLRTVAARDTSRALVGSSHSSTSGGTTVARARATRWRWPPESWAGLGLGHLLGQARRGRGPRSPVEPAGAGSPPFATQPLADQLADGHPRGEGRPGVLKHHLRAGPLARIRCSLVEPVAARRSVRSSVDLPHPLSPTRATASPSTMSRSTPRRAWRLLRSRPEPIGKDLCTPWTSTAGRGPPTVRGRRPGSPSVDRDRRDRRARANAGHLMGAATPLDRAQLGQRLVARLGRERRIGERRRSPAGGPGGRGAHRATSPPVGCGRCRATAGTAAGPPCRGGGVAEDIGRRPRPRPSVRRRARRSDRRSGRRRRGRG